MPASISGINTPAGSNSSAYGFLYDANHERIKETLPDGTIIYNLNPRTDTGLHIEIRVKPNGTVEHQNALYATGAQPFGNVTTNSSGAVLYSRYYHTDPLGSIVAVTAGNGNLIERRSYDAWGKRRNLNGTAAANAFVSSDVRQGYTGHEDLAELGLIHMNGRLYDPALGRFISADPTIQFADDLQSYNRYSYLCNNPLLGTDPSGYFLGGIFKGIGKIVKSVFKAVKAVLRNPLIRTALALYVGYELGIVGGGLFGAEHAVANGTLGGFFQGLIGSGGDLKAALGGAFSGAAFGVVGDLAKEYSWGLVQKSLAHGLAGGLSSVVSGGDFRSGFLSAGFAEFAGSKMPDMGNTGQLAARMAIGGTASMIGGGKFMNGAVTASFAYLYNECMHGESTCVRTLRGGTVVRSGWQDPADESRGAGWRVTVQEIDGGKTMYGHLMSNETPPVGTILDKNGEIANYADPTNGHSSAPHVHVQRWNPSGQIIAPGGQSPIPNGVLRTPYQRVDSLHPYGHQGEDYVAPR